MASRIRGTEEKVQPVKIALGQINVEQAAREAGVPASTLRYDLEKVNAALPDILGNRKPGPKTKDTTEAEAAEKPKESRVWLAKSVFCIYF